MSNGIPPVASGAENSRINFALGICRMQVGL